MTCLTCEKTITFDQWYYEECSAGSEDFPMFHLAPTNENIRKAYSAMLTEAAYARTQP